ncbi:unnamed protein product [Lota lota]
MLDSDIIEQENASPWISNLVVVKKKSGGADSGNRDPGPGLKQSQIDCFSAHLAQGCMLTTSLLQRLLHFRATQHNRCQWFLLHPSPVQSGRAPGQE